MSSNVIRRWIYTFTNRSRVVEIGPYPDEQEAREAFQRVYGYWPTAPLTVTPWTPRSAS